MFHFTFPQPGGKRQPGRSWGLQPAYRYKCEWLCAFMFSPGEGSLGKSSRRSRETNNRIHPWNWALRNHNTHITNYRAVFCIWVLQQQSAIQYLNVSQQQYDYWGSCDQDIYIKRKQDSAAWICFFSTTLITLSGLKGYGAALSILNQIQFAFASNLFTCKLCYWTPLRMVGSHFKRV